MINPTDKIRDRLAEVVEVFNATTDPSERIELYREIECLRADLSEMGVRP
jgi:hypothetical protein